MPQAVSDRLNQTILDLAALLVQMDLSKNTLTSLLGRDPATFKRRMQGRST